MILELDANLPFSRLVTDERMLQQMLRVRTLVVILDQHRLDKAVELFGPLLRLETRRRITWDEEESPHGMHVAQRRLGLGHLEGRDTQTPQIASVVVRGFGIVLASNHFRRHPVRCSNKRVATADRSVQLGADTEIHYDGE